MTVSAEVDESSLQARFYAGNFGLVNVGLGLNALSVLDVEVIQSLTIDHRHPNLFRLGRIDQYFFHAVFSS